MEDDHDFDEALAEIQEENDELLDDFKRARRREREIGGLRREDQLAVPEVGPEDLE